MAFEGDSGNLTALRLHIYIYIYIYIPTLSPVAPNNNKCTADSAGASSKDKKPPNSSARGTHETVTRKSTYNTKKLSTI